MATDSAAEAVRIVAAATRCPPEELYAYPIRGREHPDNLKDRG
jgi:hypothetical protein